MNFREFSKAYNDYLCHGQGTGSSMKYGSKEYRKSGRRVYGSEAANMRPKDYIAKCARQGMTNEEIIKQCETALDPGYNPTTDEKHFFMEVMRLVKNDMQHSYTNDFRELHEDYLMHFGILGMHWGIRRYQNKDGTLTQAGKKRYDKLSAKADEYDKKAGGKKSKQEMIDNLSKSAHGLGGGQMYREGDYIRFVKDNYDGYIRDKDGNPYKISEIDRTDNADKAYKLRKKAEKYGTETREDREGRLQKEYDQKKTAAEKYGFKGDDDMDGDFVNDKKDIVIDKDTIMSDKFMKQVGEFNKNYKDHDAIMRDAAVKKMAERLNISESQMKKNIDKYGRPFIYMTDGKDGGISMTADYNIGDGNHVATVEYDPNTKKVHYVSMNG